MKYRHSLKWFKAILTHISRGSYTDAIEKIYNFLFIKFNLGILLYCIIDTGHKNIRSFPDNLFRATPGNNTKIPGNHDPTALPASKEVESNFARNANLTIHLRKSIPVSPLGIAISLTLCRILAWWYTRSIAAACSTCKAIKFSRRILFDTVQLSYKLWYVCYRILCNVFGILVKESTGHRPNNHRPYNQLNNKFMFLCIWTTKICTYNTQRNMIWVQHAIASVLYEPNIASYVFRIAMI